MKKLTIYTLALLTAAISADAQRSPIRSQQDPSFAEWESTPRVYPTPPEYAGEDAFFVVNDVRADYKYEGRGMTNYYTRHERIKVLTNLGIEMFNKFSISVPHNTKILSVKARTVLPNGKVYEIPREMIKENIDGSGTYEVDIAMEGVEKNSEVELLLKEIKQGSSFGSEVFQYPVPVLNTYFEMSYPKEQVFEQKGFNGFPTVKDTLLRTNRRSISIYKANIPALQKEPNAYYDLYRMRTEYRHSYSVWPGEEVTRSNTWDDLVKWMHEEYYTLTDKEKMTVTKYISTLGITNKGNDAENIRKIENGIKTGITLYGYVDNEKPTDLDSIITYKTANEAGLIKLFAACFTLANVPHELGLTPDKYQHTFDKKFEIWGIMDNYVFYFPTQKKFLSPTSVYYRYPIVPDDVVGSTGLFCLIPADGHLTGQISRTRTVTPLTTAETQHNMNAAVTFSADMEPMVDVTYSFSGYYALSLRNSMNTLTGEHKADAIKKNISVAEKPEDIVKYSTANEGIDNYYTNKPVEISATVNAPYLVEKAGKEYLLKLGDVIGTQMQLYKENDRKLPVDLSYPNSQNRTITVALPKGYKIMNPETIKKQADYVDKDGKPVVSFTSTYKITPDKKNGDKLTVSINEFYSQLHYTTAEYERYRDVVNTAADFNKVTLVLAKK